MSDKGDVGRNAATLKNWFWDTRADLKAESPGAFDKTVRMTQGDFNVIAAAVQAAAAMALNAERVAKDAVRRVEQLEGYGIRYVGVWQRAADYSRGSVVTHAGSAWIAVAEKTCKEPGDSPDWQLMLRGAR